MQTLCAHIHYSSGGELIGYTYKTAEAETECILVKNQQGDVERVISADGTVLASYTYDAWGNTLTAEGSLAAANPIRYRGYYFDTETSLYYLQSRYYDPAVGRFINADDSSYLGADGTDNSYNLFVYCSNNPVMRIDITGYKTQKWEEQALLGAAVLMLGLAILFAAPTGGASLALGALALSSSAMVTVGGAIAITGTVMVGDALIQSNAYYARQSRKSGKERSSDKPSWVHREDVDLNISSQKNATEILNNKYGKGKWGKGPATEYNQIVKWIDRGLKMFVFILADMLREEEAW